MRISRNYSKKYSWFLDILDLVHHFACLDLTRVVSNEKFLGIIRCLRTISDPVIKSLPIHRADLGLFKLYLVQSWCKSAHR